MRGSNYVCVCVVHLLQVVTQADPDLMALHCQEIGGKDFESVEIKAKASQFIA